MDGPELTAAKLRYRFIVERHYDRTIARGDLIRCPGEHVNGDEHPSLHFVGPTGSKCHACGFKGTVVDFIMKEEGIDKRAACRRAIELAGTDGAGPKPQARPSATQRPLLKGVGVAPTPAGASAVYVYADSDGDVVAYVSRVEKPGQRKTFLQQTWDESKWVVGLQGRGPRPLYGLAQLLARPQAPVLVCEGEKTADAAACLFPAYVAVASMGGAQAVDSTDWSPLSGRRVVVWPDNDVPGREYAAAVVERVADARVLDPPTGLPKGWDLADPVPGNAAEREAVWSRIVATLDAALQENAEKDQPIDEAGDPLLDVAVRAASDEGALVELVRCLRALPPLIYEQKRKALAEAAGVRVSALDSQVVVYSTDGDQVGASPFAEIPAWPDPVDGGELLADLAAFFRRFVVLPDHGDVLLALWTLFAFSLDAFRVSPRIFVTAPEKQCGKSRVLDVLGAVLVRVLRAASVSGPLLPRVVEKYRPFILLDEVDTFLDKDHPELAGIINSGHERDGAWSWRCSDKASGFEPTPFSTWDAYAFAGIGGKMPEPTLSRCIQLVMRRKQKDEKVARLTSAARAQGRVLAARAARWAGDNAVVLREIDEVSDEASWLDRIPNDRAGDNWRPLVAVAQVCGGQWPQLATSAAVALSGGEQVADESPGPMLLADLRVILGTTEAMWSGEIVQRLLSDEFEERPWKTWNNGKGIDKRALASLLKPYGVRSKDIRVGSVSLKGYTRADLAVAMDSYAPVRDRGCAQDAQGGGEQAEPEWHSSASPTPPKNDDSSATARQQHGTSSFRVADDLGDAFATNAPATQEPSNLSCCRAVADKTGDSGGPKVEGSANGGGRNLPEGPAQPGLWDGTPRRKHPPKGYIDPETGDEADGNGGWVMP